MESAFSMAAGKSALPAIAATAGPEVRQIRRMMRRISFGGGCTRGLAMAVASGSASLDSSSSGGGGGNGKKVSTNSNYVVPLDKATSGLTRPLAEILRDLNKRVPDKIINPDNNSIPWYHANRMLSFYAPGWCGEIRDVIFSDDGNVTVLYRVTIRGSDGEAHRESSGTVTANNDRFDDPVAAAEEIAFCRACARFGFGLYLYHEDEVL